MNALIKQSFKLKKKIAETVRLANVEVEKFD